jgi:hypothetical protein
MAIPLLPKELSSVTPIKGPQGPDGKEDKKQGQWLTKLAIFTQTLKTHRQQITAEISEQLRGRITGSIHDRYIVLAPRELQEINRCLQKTEIGSFGEKIVDILIDKMRDLNRLQLDNLDKWLSGTIKLQLGFTTPKLQSYTRTREGMQSASDTLTKVKDATDSSDIVDIFGIQGRPADGIKAGWPILNPKPKSLISRTDAKPYLERFGRFSLPLLTEATTERLRSTIAFLTQRKEDGTYPYCHSIEINRQPHLLIVAAPDAAEPSAWLEAITGAEIQDDDDQQINDGQIDPSLQLEILLLDSPDDGCVRIVSHKKLSAQKLMEKMQRYIRQKPFYRFHTYNKGDVAPPSAPLLFSLCPSLKVNPEILWENPTPIEALAALRHLDDHTPLLAKYKRHFYSPQKNKLDYQEKEIAPQIYALLNWLSHCMDPNLTEEHPSYALGRLLSLANEIHRLWQVCRRTSSSSGLLGDQAFHLARRNPLEAVNHVTRRARHIFEFANRLRRQSKFDLGKDELIFLKMIGYLRTQIKLVGVPEKTSSPGQHHALVMLGYLSQPWPKSTKAPQDEQAGEPVPTSSTEKQ